MKDKFNEVIEKRCLPGVLVFTKENELVYINSAARDLLNEINSATDRIEEATQPTVPDEIHELLRSVSPYNPPKNISRPPHYCAGILRGSKQFLVRATTLFREGQGGQGGQGGRAEEGTGFSHIMVVIEPCPINRNIDLKSLRTKFSLTERESQIVEKVVKGLANKDIAEALFISEHTVRGHIQRIMAKMGIRTRTAIFYKVFE
jgi:DNA-binding CsgD family transcriptional regulator